MISPSPAKYEVYQSASGTFVLIHPPSGTSATGERLDELFLELGAQIPAQSGPPPLKGPGWSRSVLAAIGVTALLPLLWVGAFQYTLARTLDDAHLGSVQDRQTTDAVLDVQSTALQIQRLKHDIETLQRLYLTCGTRPGTVDSE